MLLDTSGLFCCLDGTDPRHGDAVTLYGAAPRRVTHNYVLAELVTLAHARGHDRQTALAFVAAFLDDPEVDVIWVGEALHRQAIALLQRQADKTYSLCDAVSLVLMSKHGIMESLTTDRHFEQAGFVRLLK